MPAIKNNDIISFSFNAICDTSSNARPWYIIYLTPTSKDCNPDSGSLFFSRCAPKAPNITDIKANDAPKNSILFISSQNLKVLF